MGLREGPIRQELRRLVRKTPTLSFDEVQMEVLALEEEQEDNWPPSICLVVGKQAIDPQPTVTDWKQEFKNEILQEVKDQMTQMTKTILSEIKDNVNMRPTPHMPHCSKHFLVITIEMVPGLDPLLDLLGLNGTHRGIQFVTPVAKLGMLVVIALLGHLTRIFSFSGHRGSSVWTPHNI